MKQKKVTLAVLLHYCSWGYLVTLSKVATVYCRILYTLKGIRLGKGSNFMGVPIISLFPHSKIIIGKNIEVRSSVYSNLIGLNRRTIISTHSENAEIIIGDDCGLSGSSIAAVCSITIGDNVMIGANVLISDFDWHAVNPIDRLLDSPSKGLPIIISDNVFIGYAVTILKGVKIGKNSVIGANSVVTSNIDENVIAAGNPCKFIAKL